MGAERPRSENKGRFSTEKKKVPSDLEKKNVPCAVWSGETSLPKDERCTGKKMDLSASKTRKNRYGWPSVSSGFNARTRSNRYGEKAVSVQRRAERTPGGSCGRVGAGRN